MNDIPSGPVLAFSRESKFSFENFDAIMPSTRPWRIKNAWPMQGVVFVAGASGAAKTFFTLDGLLKLAAGSATVWGRKARQCGVVYVAAEDPDGCRARVRAWKMKKAEHRTTPVPFDLVPQSFNLLDPGDVDDFKASLRLKADEMADMDTPLGVVGIDTFSCCIPGSDENSAVDMSRALEVLTAIAREFGVLVVVVAHFGKSGAGGGIRGWSGLGFNADGMIILERDEEDPGLRLVTFQKVKNGVDGSRLSFVLDEVELGMFDDDNDAMTSCVVAFRETPQQPSRRKPRVEHKPGPKLILQALGQLLDLGTTYVVPPVSGVSPGTSGVHRLELRARTFASGYLGEDDNEKSAIRSFNRDLLSLTGGGVLREEEGIVWRIRK